MSSFEKKTVLITGGASGIGLLSAQNYAKLGANVVMVDYNQEALDERVAEIKAYNENVLGICIDIREYAKVEEACKQAYDTFGSIDILLNCAGGNEIRLCNKPGLEFHELPIEVFDFGLDVNLKGAIYFDHAALKYMAMQNSGVIIHLGSITGAEGSPNGVAYATAKSALMHGTTLSIAQAGAKHNVRCVCLALGPILTRPAMANMKTMLGRAGEVQEVVDLILYVTGEDGAFMTGNTIYLDGGRNALTRG